MQKPERTIGSRGRSTNIPTKLKEDALKIKNSLKEQKNQIVERLSLPIKEEISTPQPIIEIPVQEEEISAPQPIIEIPVQEEEISAPQPIIEISVQKFTTLKEQSFFN